VGPDDNLPGILPTPFERRRRTRTVADMKKMMIESNSDAVAKLVLSWVEGA
jgi:hypothetical protein